MTTQSIALKVLLRQRHLQGHRAFCREYDKLADEIDTDLKGSWPSKAQFYRWISGDLIGLPYAHHCRILEKMFPGWTAEQLFQAHDGRIEFVPEPPASQASRSDQRPIPVTIPTGHGVADVVAVFPSRSEFTHEMPPRHLFDGAKRIRMVGLSLNLLCQQYPDKALLELLESGASVECLFLSPDGQYIKLREEEEAHPPGLLSTLTTVNIAALRRIRTRLSPEARENLKIRTYDEVVRFNITIVDNETCVVQPYLPDARGVESPTLVLENQTDVMGLFDTFTQVFTSMWNRAKEVSE